MAEAAPGLQFAWIHREGRGKEGERVKASWLIDGSGRAYARIDHPAHEVEAMHICTLFFSPTGSVDGKPTFEEDRAYSDADKAREYCERMAVIAAARPAADGRLD